MKRTTASLALLFALAIAADELRASIESWIFFHIDPQLAGSTALLFIHAALYILIFSFAGALISLRFRNRPSVLAAGLGIGLLVLAPAVLQGDTHPIHYATHGPWWLNALGWVNWFGPPIASAVGAALMAAFIKGRQSPPANAA